MTKQKKKAAVLLMLKIDIIERITDLTDNDRIKLNSSYRSKLKTLYPIDF